MRALGSLVALGVLLALPGAGPHTIFQTPPDLWGEVEIRGIRAPDTGDSLRIRRAVAG